MFESIHVKRSKEIFKWLKLRNSAKTYVLPESFTLTEDQRKELTRQKNESWGEPNAPDL